MAWVIWLSAAIILVIVEAMTLTFYFLWIAIGALAAMVVSFLFPESWELQIATCAIVTIILTFATKKLTRRLHNRSEGYVSQSVVKGKTGYVVDRIGPDKTGTVRVGSDTWSARSETVLEPGEPVIVAEQEGAILIVYKGGDS